MSLSPFCYPRPGGGIVGLEGHAFEGVVQPDEVFRPVDYCGSGCLLALSIATAPSVRPLACITAAACPSRSDVAICALSLRSAACEMNSGTGPPSPGRGRS